MSILGHDEGKDAVLYNLGTDANVAQFVSFGPDLKLRYQRLVTSEKCASSSPESLVRTLLKAAPAHKVNIRTFRPRVTTASEFIYGLDNESEILSHLSRLANSGFFTIVNETLDMSTGGTGGVLLGDVVEFAPCDTPRAVDLQGAASLPRAVGIKMLEIVYGSPLALDYDRRLRVEFTVHPARCGWLHQHTVIWQIDHAEHVPNSVTVSWPNHFSRFIGDKAFGLALCSAFHLPVPKSCVISRTLAPFSFGETTGTGDAWMRTCTREPIPGRFSTLSQWSDPFSLMNIEDPQGVFVASVLAQEGVDPLYSGSLVVGDDGQLIIEGVKGPGTEFMLARQTPEPLPEQVVKSVSLLYAAVSRDLGPVGIEWVHDGYRTWIVQVHPGRTCTKEKLIVPGSVEEYRIFDMKQGLESLRRLVGGIDRTKTGIVVAGDVGVTSHVGDILRQAGVASYIDPLGTM